MAHGKHHGHHGGGHHFMGLAILSAIPGYPLLLLGFALIVCCGL